MESFLGFLVFATIIGIIIYSANKKKQENIEEEKVRKEELEQKKQKELESLKEKWENKKKDFEIKGLPIINIETLNLTKGEVCHFAGDGCFCKQKQQTVGYQGGSRGVSIRVMKGVSFRVGNYQGHYVKQDIIERTNGLIYLTNKKIIFTAIKNSSVIRFKDIINLNADANMLQIQTEKKTFLFEIVNSFDFLIILEFIMKDMQNENNETID